MKKINFSAHCRAALALFAALFLVLTGCNFSETRTDGTTTGTLTLMSWNVHNLFDGLDNGSEYREFLQESGWSVERYLGRINTLSAAIRSIQPLPDVISFQEVEFLEVIEDLARAICSSYKWSYFARNPNAALGIGVISRIPILEGKSHSITIGTETTPRPVLETRMLAEGEEFVIFSNHWKSKLGGEDATESVRRASARVILRRVRELWEIEPDLKIIVTGDLNVNHDDFYRREAAIICAVMPDDPFSARITGCIDEDGEEHPKRQKDFFVLTGNKPPIPIYFPQGTIVFFSPWMDELEDGTYFFRNTWQTIDHFLLTHQFFYNTGWSYVQTEVLNQPPFANADGFPVPYNVRTGFGLSDHLPLLLTLRMYSYIYAAIVPPPTTMSPSYMTAACPGVIAR